MEPRNFLRKKDSNFKSIYLFNFNIVEDVSLIREQRNLTLRKRKLSTFLDIKRGIIDNKIESNKLTNFFFESSLKLKEGNILDEKILKEINDKISLLKDEISQENLNHWKLIDSICYYIEIDINNENRIKLLIDFLNHLSYATEKRGKCLFFNNEHILLYIKLLEKYKINSEIFSKIVDYISQIIINSIINQNKIVNNQSNENQFWNLFLLIYNNSEICNSNSYFNFLASFDKIFYSEQTKKFQFLLEEKSKEELIKTVYNNEQINLDKKKIVNLYIIYQRLAMSSSNEIIQLFFNKDMEGYYILDLLIKLSIPYDDLNYLTLCIIGDIASTDEIEIDRKLLDTNSFIFIKEIIENEKTKNINKKYVLWVLSNLCNDAIFYDELIKNNLFKDIISILPNINYIEAVNEGLICLGNAILLGNEVINLKLIDLGLFECLFKLMDEYNDRNILNNCFNIFLIVIEKGNFYSDKDNEQNNKFNLFLQKFNELGGEERIQKLYRRVQNKELIQSIDNFLETYYPKN